MSYNTQFHKKVTESPFKSCNHNLIDTHLHFVDFLQQSDGMKALLKAMDDAHISKVVVAGLPLVKKWELSEPDQPHYYLDDNAKCYYFSLTDEILSKYYQALSGKNKKRVAPMLCGFNPTDKNSINYVETKISEDKIWKGIGEILCRHDDLTNLTMEEVSRMNHPALYPVYELAASKNLPVLIHQNSTSVGHHDRFEYLHEVKTALSDFPKTQFVWAHAGISRRVFHKDYAKMVEEVLTEHNNIVVDISWVGYDEVICNNFEPKKHWFDLFEKFPDRILIGSDNCGHFDYLGETMGRYNNLIDKLSTSAREMICTENAERIWNFG